MSKPRTIKLFCPSLSKLVELVTWDEQRLDLGSIAGSFGLDPSTVKINGHFISRGVDLVSNSVTWRSLLMFFSAKGLSTGKHDRDALVVDGKLTKVGTKRKRFCFSLYFFTMKYESLVSLNQSCSSCLPITGSYDCQPNHTGISQNQNKKLRDSNSDFRGNGDDRLGCRYLNENMKRPRENEGKRW
ncbi:hypothetical protein EZV62_019445 [Acer yangbiense]|uniref:Uncharacterized protein n=1 Tax=Acer yangbiense TaxID=1000413 RepID=A0A5C7HBG7_9ROSI|nr:hypothetical protein EZV62_019445 [Acer yangbiense]